MVSDSNVWLLWSSAFLLPWAVLYWRFPEHRREMARMSLFTAPFGLTEPLFVPEYWNPPSLFDLAGRTGFDLESLIFCFAIGGIGAVLFNVAARRDLAPMPAGTRHQSHHRYHRWALAAPVLILPPLYLLPWNPIYPAILAMLTGAAAAAACRPDLTAKMLGSGGLFLALYVILLAGLEWSAPGYIDRVWNLGALTGVRFWGQPLEELLFAVSFGMYWAGLYEHFTWRRLVAAGHPRGAAR
ncbi:MAG: lycopene cyclase domain-containing protein [Gemmatimonadota bacterium]